MSADCCSHVCEQGRDCPVRKATGCSVKAAPKPVEPPPIDRKDRVLHLAEWLALSFFYVCTLAAAAGFFTQG
jgi:hypothetical protein